MTISNVRLVVRGLAKTPGFTVTVVLGLAVAFSVRRFVESTLFGLTAADPLTYAVVAGVLVAVTLPASLRPAPRAARVDPMIALRAE